MPKPIKPSEIGAAKLANIPEVVFTVVNALLAKKYSNGRATIKQEEIVNALVDQGVWRDTVFAEGYLNFEEAYEAQGWKVEYDKPGYNESYGAFFVFKAK